MSFDLQAARADVAAYDPHTTDAFLHARTGTFLHLALNEIEQQAKRIAELEESLQRERAMTFSKIQRQRHAIARLSEAKRERGKALVEERISGEFSDWIENQCPHWDIDEEPFCVELDGPCEYHEGKCPISMELHRIAREQLVREGRI